MRRTEEQRACTEAGAAVGRGRGATSHEEMGVPAMPIETSSGNWIVAPEHVSVSPYPCTSGASSAVRTHSCTSAEMAPPPETQTRSRPPTSFLNFLSSTLKSGVARRCMAARDFIATASEMRNCGTKPAFFTLTSAPAMMPSHTFGTPTMMCGWNSSRPPFG